MDGVHRNSQTILDQLPRARSIAEAEMPRFRQQTSAFIELLADKGASAGAFANNAVSNRQE
jgi:hypothetical protein